MTFIALLFMAYMFVWNVGVVQPTRPSNGVPQTCLSAAESYACYKYFMNGPKEEAVSWCEGFYTVAAKKEVNVTNLRIDNTKGEAHLVMQNGGLYNVVDFTSEVVKAGYKYPDASELKEVVKGTGGADGNASEEYDETKAVLLCIDPSKGGYLFKTQSSVRPTL